MEIENVLNRVVTKSNLKMLSRLIELYGYDNPFQSYRSTGKALGVSHESVRYHFKELERAGYLKIEYINQRKIKVNLSETLVNELVK